MASFSERIKALEEKLKKLDILLNNTEAEINKLESERKLDKGQIKGKEKELEEKVIFFTFFASLNSVIENKKENITNIYL